MKKLSLIVFAGCALAFNASAGIVDFDSISATCCFGDVTPATGRGPLLVLTGITFDGGVVMDDTGWGGAETTFPNLYGTSDFASLADSSSLPGFITILFDSPENNLALDLINGSSAGNFTLSAYDPLNALLGSTVVNLPGFGATGFVQNVAVNYTGMSKVTITSGQGAGNVVFAIDTVSFGGSGPGGVGTPEPGTFLFAAGSLAALAFRRFRQVRG